MRSEHGEPLVWQTIGGVDGAGQTSLCRCGGSANKPFCDGTHARKGFDGTEADPPAPYDERSKAYPGTHVVVRDDRAMATEIGVVDDGPLFVTGGVPVRRADGGVMEVRNRQTLCRCGSSSNKPLCEGSHAKAGFRDASR